MSIAQPNVPEWALTPEEERAWRAFLTMQRRLFVHLHRQLQGEFGLSGSDFEILVNLSEARGGRLRAFELSKATQWEKSRMSHQLRRMAERGLVRREATQDPRYADIVITEEGLAAIAKAAPRNAEAVRALFAEPIRDDRMVAFAEACESVSEATLRHKVGDYGSDAAADGEAGAADTGTGADAASEAEAGTAAEAGSEACLGEGSGAAVDSGSGAAGDSGSGAAADSGSGAAGDSGSGAAADSGSGASAEPGVSA
jgi:DNA-binding MarR family transcriptional regulator